MVFCGVCCDIFMYNILLDCLCVERVLVLLEDMEKSEMVIGIIMYNIIIKGMCKAGMVEEVWCLFCNFDFKGVMFDVVMYMIMIVGFFRKGMWCEVYDLCIRMIMDGFMLIEWRYKRGY